MVLNCLSRGSFSVLTVNSRIKFNGPTCRKQSEQYNVMNMDENERIQKAAVLLSIDPEVHELISINNYLNDRNNLLLKILCSYSSDIGL